MDQNVDNGNNQRMFTEDEVNEIVRKRLERYKDKHSSDEEVAKLSAELDERAEALKKRELEVSCLDFLYKNRMDPYMMEVIKADDLDDFINKACKVRQMIVDANRSIPPAFNPETSQEDSGSNKIAEAFSIGYRRQPKEI